MEYPYLSIWINGREVEIGEICAGYEGRDAFERSTFGFIRDWLGGRSVFEIQTSGSTGVPKRITITREQMEASARLTAQALGLQRGYHALVCLDTQYIAGQMMLVRSFVTGMKIIAVTPVANPLEKIPKTVHLDFAALVPYQVHTIVHTTWPNDLIWPGIIIIGGGALDEATQGRLQELTCQCYATYGMTETISHIALQRLNGDGRTTDFTTLPGIHIAVDNRGCLMLEASHLPERIITNDLVEMKSPNTFKWIGRWDNIINTGGMKVIPEKIEESIKQIADTLNLPERFIITDVPDAKLGSKVVLILERSDSLTVPEQELLKTAFRKILFKHEVPKAIYTVSPFELTVTGKINRTAIKKKLNS